MNRTVDSRQTMISFGRGLFVLRYASCEVLQAPPRVRFAVAAGSTPGVRILAMPGTVAGELHQVGDLAVLASEGPGGLEVRVEESRPGGGLGCSLALDRLGGPAQEPARTAPDRMAAFAVPVAYPAGVAGPAPASPPAGVAPVLAHLSHRGDVALGLGDWMGGPQAPSPIEGLAIGAPEAVAAGLEYQVMSVGTDRWSDWVRAGSYAGSRGQGRPLRAIRLRVPDAGAYRLRAEVLFLGAAIAEKAGRSVEFMSSSPFDAMVGFRIELDREAARDVAPTTLAVPEASTSRLKVFRSSRAS